MEAKSNSKPAISIDTYTFTASPLEMFVGQTKLAVGTCFYWKSGGKNYLVTNWHNVTGKNPRTGKHLNENLAEPDRVRFDLWEKGQLSNSLYGLLELHDAAGPKWLEHPVYRNAVDVVCIELPQKVDPHLFPINTEPQSQLKITIADEVYILGYPLGIGPNRLPIWKRASIASEPEINAEELPLLYVDTASSQGMSGSPVIRRSTGGGRTEDGRFVIAAGIQVRFLGVYSGRLSSGDRHDAQLGLVWKAQVIDEIIAGGIRGGTPKPI